MLRGAEELDHHDQACLLPGSLNNLIDPDGANPVGIVFRSIVSVWTTIRWRLCADSSRLRRKADCSSTTF